MNLLNGHGSSIGAKEILLPPVEPGFEVSWAGEDPLHRYWFGSEDGRLLFLDPKTSERFGPFDVALSGEAINGVAFGESSIVVTTRRDVVCVRFVEGVEHVAALHIGRTGVCVSAQGEYYAPVGQRGLLKLVARPQTLAVSILSSVGQEMNAYFYRIACLTSPDQRGAGVATPARRIRGAAAPGV